MTTIEWCRNDDGTLGKSWNVTRGCSTISPGCEHCYAMKMAHRFSAHGQPYDGLTKLTKHGPRWTGEVRCVLEMLEAPLHWRKPTRIFVDSMSDLFHDKVPDEFIAAVFGVMAACPQHTFIVLTKRAKRMREWFAWLGKADPDGSFPLHRDVVRRHLAKYKFDAPYAPTIRWPLPDVWLGVSVENQEAADERIPYLLETPAAVRWVSVEPMLGAINLRHIDADAAGSTSPCQVDALTGRHTDMGRPCADVTRLDWVICGCESGPNARPMDLNWARSLRDQCQAAGASYFLKQATVGGKLVKTPELDGRRCVEFPEMHGGAK